MTEQKIDTKTARANMISQQIRPMSVDRVEILDLFQSIPREDFVPLEYRDLAYSDSELPIGHGQKMLTPQFSSRMLQCLNLKETDKVLEIGTGTGYLTALLAKLTHKVYSIDKYSEFSHNAAKKLARYGIDNVECLTADGRKGLGSHQPYDVMVISGSLPALDEVLLQQLAVGGRLFVVLGLGQCQTAHLFTRLSVDDWQDQKLFETSIDPLEGEHVEKFVF